MMLTLQDLLRTRTAQPPLNKAMYFDGVDDRIQIPISSSLTNFYAKSVILLLRPFSYPSVWEPYDGGYWVSPYGDLYQNIGTSLFYFLKNTAGTVVSMRYGIPSSELYTWHHLTTAWDGSTAKLYFNSKLVASTSFSGTLASSAYPHTIGSRYYGVYPFKGYMAQVLIYSRALSDSEIIHNMSNPNNPIRNGLVLWLDARACDTSKNICWDLSGNGNHGTMYGVQIVSLPNQVVVGGSL
jgi:hypothetical protein